MLPDPNAYAFEQSDRRDITVQLVVDHLGDPGVDDKLRALSAWCGRSEETRAVRGDPVTRRKGDRVCLGVDRIDTGGSLVALCRRAVRYVRRRSVISGGNDPTV